MGVEPTPPAEGGKHPVLKTGASTADLAILLVDARAGLLEQTRRHATIASLMGIRQFVLAVNKIDLVDYSEARFNEIAHDFKELAISLGVSKVTAIPVSALKGENLKVADFWHFAPLKAALAKAK